MRIPLGQGRFALVDDCDSPRVLAGRWYLHRNGAGVVYVRGRVDDRRPVYLHRFILGAPAGAQVDHINDDPLDCRRANLRLVTAGQNVQRARLSAGRSIYKGVSWAAQRQRWRVRVRTGDGRRSFGMYETEIEAARVYDAIAREHHGVFARLNFPD